ncbi:MAG TPA: FAD-dependent oxidoreductase [Clostridiaceae bacterium]|nr:FAD-dependent oxidoreductase [Clostridiaceae bacterium]
MEQKEEVVKEVDLAIIGGGPAGLAVAVEAWKHGVKDILILEREIELGGILQQCIHTGFGLKVFGEELTGPEYAERFIKQVEYLGIEFKLDTMVIDISIDKIPTVKNIGDKFIDKSIIEEIDIDGIVSDGTTSNRITDDRIACDRINYDRINHDRTSGYKIITAVNKKDGLIRLKAKTVVLAMGCRERTRGALNIPGTRPAGIFTAGTAQRFVNMEGYLPGKKVVILGSGDIGLIMARRMTLEGAEVKMVCELMSYPGGLNRNIVQCLNDFNIPLKLNYTVVEIHGKKRVEGVTIAQVDNNRKPITGTYEYVKCDTLLLSVGLIPENELSIEAGVAIDPITLGPIVNESMETSIEGIFACGNVVHVHDLVDRVTEEAMLAGRSAGRYIHSIRDKKQYKSMIYI